MDHLTGNTRKLLWNLMINPELRAKAKDAGMGSVADECGIKLRQEELYAVEKVDLDDLGDLLSSVERDLSMVMGGSRPRRAIALSDGAIKELREALDIRDSEE